MRMNSERVQMRIKDMADRLTAQGYRRVSNSCRMIARVDRPDWRLFMAKEHSPWNIDEGLAWIEGLGYRAASDYYRRVHSKDKKMVTTEIFKRIPSGGDSLCGFVPAAQEKAVEIAMKKERNDMTCKQPVLPEDLVGKYKIHSMNVVTGRSVSAANTFHDSFDVALAKCKSIVRRDPDVQMVILKCTHVVQTTNPPVEVIDLEEIERHAD